MTASLTTYCPQIEHAARAAGISPNLVKAIVVIESGGNPFAWNPEPRYRYLVDARTGKPFRPITLAERASEFPPGDFHALGGDADQEWWGQQASWGLMQIMGALAREQGFAGPYLPELTDPAINLALGCKVLHALILWANRDTAKAVAGYNAGRGGWHSAAGQAYAAKVLSTLHEIERRLA